MIFFSNYNQKDGWVTIHACKTPCHQNAVGYQRSLPSSHPHYLVYERPGNLYLNMIDPSVPLFLPPLFSEFLRFARYYWEEGGNLLAHCNHGNSRAPSLALLFLAKVVGVPPAENFERAFAGFVKVFPNYCPGQGVQIYFRKNWISL